MLGFGGSVQVGPYLDDRKQGGVDQVGMGVDCAAVVWGPYFSRVLSRCSRTVIRQADAFFRPGRNIIILILVKRNWTLLARKPTTDNLVSVG